MTGGARPPRGDDGQAAAGLAQFAAQPGQILVQGVVTDLSAFGPARPDQITAAHQVPVRGDERGQQPELRRGQHDPGTVHRRTVPDRVQDQSTGRGGRRGRGPLEHRPQPGGELGEVERLRQVVVTPGREAGQPVGEVAPCGQEDDRGVEPARAHRLAYVPSVRVGQANVQDDRGDVGADQAQGGGAIGGRDGIEVLVVQTATEHITQGVIILDDQNLAAHAPPSVFRPWESVLVAVMR